MQSRESSASNSDREDSPAPGLQGEGRIELFHALDNPSIVTRSQRMRPSPWLIAGLFLMGAGARAVAADRVSVAAAANLVYVLDPLNAEFARVCPDVAVTSEIGASG